jgi:hypothetical protein
MDLVETKQAIGGSTEMLALSALALTSADVAFFSPPPHRPGRPERRANGGRGGARALIRTLRRELALATSDSAAGWIPRISERYPY